MAMLGILLFYVLALIVAFAVISPILLIILLFIWVKIIISAFVKSRRTNKDFSDCLAIRTRKKFVFFTSITAIISISFVGINYYKARQCIILPNGYTIGKGAIFDFKFSLELNRFIILDNDFLSYRFYL